MAFKNSDNEVHDMSTLSPAEMARQLVEQECHGRGDVAGALSRLERRYRITKWQLSHLRGGRAKTCEAGLFARLRFAYLDMCQRQINRLRHDIEIEKARGSGDDFADFMVEVEDLGRRVSEKITAHKRR